MHISHEMENLVDDVAGGLDDIDKAVRLINEGTTEGLDPNIEFDAEMLAGQYAYQAALHGKDHDADADEGEVKGALLDLGRAGANFDEEEAMNYAMKIDRES